MYEEVVLDKCDEAMEQVAQNTLPRDVVDTSSLEVCKTRLDGALDNMMWYEVSQPTAGVL